MVYILAGINDISILDRKTRTVRSRFGEVDGATSYLIDQLGSLYRAVHRVSPTTKIVTCSLYGIDLATYNKATVPHPDQDLVNNIIATANKLIIAMNIENNVLTPRISNIIHRYNGHTKRPQHMYLRLRDGCHPTEETQQKIAKYLARSIISNRDLGNHL